MKLPSVIVIAVASVGCERAAEPSSLPENVQEDQAIILREGQAVVLTPEGDEAVTIGAAVVDGNLSLGEIASGEREFQVTWKGAGSWETATTHKDGDRLIVIIDQDGDGVPDLRAVMEDGVTTRFRLAEPRWIETAPDE